MSDYFVGEIRLFSFPWAPRDWALCDGKILTIQQNVALFSLLGNKFGGDGKNNFALPDMRGRVPVNEGKSQVTPGVYYAMGSTGGVENVTLTSAQLSAHSHTAYASNTPGDPTLNPKKIPGQAYLATATAAGGATSNYYGPRAVSTATTVLNPATVSVTGGGGAHSNVQPFAATNYSISTVGLYPSRQ